MDTENDDHDYDFVGPSKLPPPAVCKTKLQNKQKTANAKIVSKSTTKSTPTPAGLTVPTCSFKKIISAVSIVAVLALITCLSIVIFHHINGKTETDHNIHEKSTSTVLSKDESRRITTNARGLITIGPGPTKNASIEAVTRFRKRKCDKNITESHLPCNMSRGSIGKANQTAASLLNSIHNENWTNHLTRLFYTGSLIRRVDHLSKDSSVSNQGFSKTPQRMMDIFNNSLAKMINNLNSKRHLFEYFMFNGSDIGSVVEDDELLQILGITNTSDIRNELMDLIGYTKMLTPVVLKMQKLSLTLVNQSIAFAKEVINVHRYAPFAQWILDHPCWLTELPQFLAFYQSNAERLFVEYLKTALKRGEKEKFDDYKKSIFWDRPTLVKILRLQLRVCKIVLQIPRTSTHFIEQKCFLQNYL